MFAKCGGENGGEKVIGKAQRKSVLATLLLGLQHNALNYHCYI